MTSISRPSRRDFLRHAAVFASAGGLAPGLTPHLFRGRRLDVVIRGGMLIDGSGTPAVRADLGITGGRISRIGQLGNEAAGRVIDATGLVVAPGFIDVHAHTNLIGNPRGQSKVYQGVTLDLTGPDGGSSFPNRVDGPGLVTDADQCSSFRAWKERHGDIAMNIGSYVGHGTVRNLVLGPVQRPPTDRELGVMQDLVRQAMEEGAIGLSSGLEYNPSGFAETEEIIALAKVAAEYGRPYGTHMRSEDRLLVESTEESIRICRESGAPLLITHMKVGGRPNWSKIDALIETVERARADGLNVHCDRYPYEAWSTSLSINFPGWSKEGGRFRERLQDPQQRIRMKAETLESVEANGGWGALMISGGVRGSDRELIGQRVNEVAEEKGVDSYDLACDLLARGSVSIIGFGMSEENTERIIALPYCMIASDGSAMVASDTPGGHPRSFGTFPRAIRRYVRERKLVSLEEMIRKMTSLPAAVFNLQDRGILAEDKVADVVVFDPDTIADESTYIEARKYATGIEYLLVNGKIAVDQGRQTEAAAGTVVTSTGE